MLSDAPPVSSLHTPSLPALSPLKCSHHCSSPPPDFLQKPMSVQPQEAEARSEGVDGLPAPEKLPTSGCQISILNPTKSPPVPAVSETSTHHSVVGENDVPSPAKLRKAWHLRDMGRMSVAGRRVHGDEATVFNTPNLSQAACNRMANFRDGLADHIWRSCCI